MLKLVFWLACISREEGGWADIKKGGWADIKKGGGLI